MLRLAFSRVRLALERTGTRAQALCAEVAAVADRWMTHFADCGVSSRDRELLAEQIDRPFLREQRQNWAQRA